MTRHETRFMVVFLDVEFLFSFTPLETALSWKKRIKEKESLWFSGGWVHLLEGDEVVFPFLYSLKEI